MLLCDITHNLSFAKTLKKCLENIEKGDSLSNAMQHFPKTFSPLIINVVKIGESTGKLADSFAEIQNYLEFESKNSKQLQATFRYPMFVGITVFIAMTVLNIFVIPSFASFYSKTINFP